MMNLKSGNITELARSKSQKSTGYTIQMWLRDSGTVDFFTLWKNKHNENFLSIPVELNSLTSKMWIKETNSIGIVSRQGKNGGTYAHKEIAIHFMCWLSVDVTLNVIEKYMEVITVFARIRKMIFVPRKLTMKKGRCR